MAWYGWHLGLNGPFAADTLILRQAIKQYMQNFRVNDLENLLKNYLMRVQL
jgi:hypothetical protein